ncbi:hypothetical protein ACIQBJ_02615 [Kitasatospora sp. NPDC088391]|uniref:hypothetical protein n=1 Tax=Kitasatospora sp. NPDC088391 TaxID=3364074 RepID=UPI0038047F0A
MEFTISGRIRQRGRRQIGWSVPGIAGSTAWALTAGDELRGTALFALGFCVVVLLLGIHELRRLRRPFRLRLDEYGVGLPDVRLPWDAVESIALRYRERSAEEPETSVRPPRLVLRLTPEADPDRPGGPRDLRGPGGPANATPRRSRPLPWPTAPTAPSGGGTTGTADELTLVNCADLDQSLAELVGALHEFAGHRFESAPRSVLPPGPRDRYDPHLGGAERRFTVEDGNLARLLLLLAATAASLAPFLVGHLRGAPPGPEALYVLWALLALLFGRLSFRAGRRWRRPLRLRIGPDGIGLREPGGEEVFLRWTDLGAVTTAPLPDSLDRRPFLTVYAAPGADLPLTAPFLSDGHRGYGLIRLDRLPEQGQGVPAALRAFAADRYTSRS